MNSTILKRAHLDEEEVEVVRACQGLKGDLYGDVVERAIKVIDEHGGCPLYDVARYLVLIEIIQKLTNQGVTKCLKLAS